MGIGVDFYGNEPTTTTMVRVFGSLDAQTEAERRVPPAGWSARDSVLRDMARDLRSGAWRPLEDDMRRGQREGER